ncbi:ComF family protein [candidate division KSB1 bacterium]|nr:ComF family protein [candidate division KSB1 bacterium]
MNVAPLYKWAQPYSDAVLNFIYPPYCIVCKSRFEPGLTLICETCWRNLPRIDNTQNQKRSRANLDFADSYIPMILSVWEFNDAVQQVIHEIKFFGKKSFAKFVGREMADLMTHDKDYLETDMIIPVPLHKTKLRERGFNQSLLLSQAISKLTNIPVNQKILNRIRYTKPQSRLNAFERQQNVKDAFRVIDPSAVKGKTVVLVDDVLTTGSTMRACAESLDSAGVAKILALTAAATL